MNQLELDNLITKSLEQAEIAGFRQDLRDNIAWDALVCYRHVLGFAYIKLSQVDMRTLRLHIWPEGIRIQKKPVWPIHDHVFDLRSLVVQGDIQDSRFSIHKDPKGKSVIYEVEYNTLGSRRIRTQHRVNCTSSSTTIITQGGTYEVPEGEFHCSEAINNKHTVTLVETSPRRNRLPRVVGDHDGENEYSYTLEPIDITQL